MKNLLLRKPIYSFGKISYLSTHIKFQCDIKAITVCLVSGVKTFDLPKKIAQARNVSSVRLYACV